MKHIGDVIWFCESWTDRIVCGVISNIILEKEYYEVEGNVYRFGGEKSFIGTCPVAFDNYWETEEEARFAITQRNKKRIEKYKSEIVTVQDLVNFPLINNFGSEEYTDYEAIQAYKERATELGFVLQEE